jgi:putative ABC transport system permease protein
VRLLGLIKDRLRALLGREAVIGDIDDEMRTHVELETETNIAKGMTPVEARRAAIRSFGNMGAARDLAYQVRGGGIVESIGQDIGYGWRMLRKNPGSTLAIVFILAVGIGANTAIFSVLNAVLLRRLPIAAPERVAVVELNIPRLNLFRTQISPLQYLDFSRQSDVFESTADMSEHSLNLTGTGLPQRLLAGRVTASFFPMLGVAPVAGRMFTEDEDHYGAGNVCVLSYRQWKQLFNNQAGAIGSSIQLDGQGYQIIGAAPRALEEIYPKVDIWVPAAWSPAQLYENRRWSLYTNMLARLKQGVTFAQAQSAMDALSQTLQYGVSGSALEVRPLPDQKFGEVRKPLYLLFCAVAVVLLISCVNVASLLLARGSARSREIAVRMALGAGRLRVERQLLIESLMLAMTGGLLGLLAGIAGTPVLTAIAPRDLPRIDAVRVDSGVLLFTLAISLACGVAFGLAPAIAASKTDLVTALKDAVRSSAGRMSERVRQVLVITEVALALVVLISAGLLARSFAKVLDVNPGFNSKNVLTARIALPETYNRQKLSVFYDTLLQRVSALPGITGAAVAYEPPLMDGDNTVFTIRNRQAAPDEPDTHTDYVFVSPDYMNTMGIPLVRGRGFQASDFNPDGSKAVMIDEALARIFWPNSDPIGAEITFGSDVWQTIVGVAGAVHNKDLTAESKGTVYFPGYVDMASSLVVRSSSDPRNMASAILDQVLSIDHDQPIFDVRTMDDRLAQVLEVRKFAVALLVTFAAVALLLASVGLYGVIGYAVSQRTQEIGVRMALGARGSNVLRLVVGQGLRLATIGLGIGLTGAYALNRVMATFLFGVRPTDPVTFVVVPLLVLAVTLVSSYVPARRAAKVDPMTALRSE